jgi:hypothetical protein
VRVGKTVKPGRCGSARWVTKFGDKLIAVRYRYDKRRGMRYTTVELVVDACPWLPGTRFPSGPDREGLGPETVFVRISFGEENLRERIKAVGGRWDKTRKAWEVRLDHVTRLGLRDRIQFLTDPPANSGTSRTRHSS